MNYKLLLLITFLLFFLGCNKKNPDNPTQSAQPVSTFAGSGAVGANNGNGADASFSNPSGIAIDASGNIYVADTGNDLIRKITPDGSVSTFASTGKGTGPTSLAFDASGNLYVTDFNTEVVQKITADGTVHFFAPCGDTTHMSPFYPGGIAVDAQGTVWVVGSEGISVMLKITPAGMGSGIDIHNLPISNGNMVFDSFGNLFVAGNSGVNSIQKIDVNNKLTVVAGNGNVGTLDGPGAQANFDEPQGVCVDAAGDLYVADTGNSLIRKINSADIVSTVAGTGSQGRTNGSFTEASFNMPKAIVMDKAGNLYVADSGNNMIRKITLSN